MQKLDKLSGWVIKKYIGDKKTHKRFLFLKKGDFTMKYYDSENVRISGNYSINFQNL